jgi:hypothetical protein
MVLGDQINRQKSLKTNTMNEVVFLKTFLTAVTPNMHKVRRASLASCVSILLNGAKASVTGMGRGISSSAYEKIASNKLTAYCLTSISSRKHSLFTKLYISSL